MKSPIKLLITLLAFSMGALAPLSAQEKKGRGGNPDAQVERLDQAVGLTADQKAKIKEIYTKNMEKARDASPEDRRAIMQAQRDGVRAVLTPEQHKKFDEMPQGKGGKGGGKGGRKKSDN
jgi:Spy/CpxP family protein refolding chaperone